MFVSAVLGSVWGLFGIGLVTVIGVKARFGVVAAGFFFFLCVVIQSLRADFWSTAIVSAVGVFDLAYFFTPPDFSFGISQPMDAIALLAFVICSFVTAHSMDDFRRKRNLGGTQAATQSGTAAASATLSGRPWVALLGHFGDALVIGAFLVLAYGIAARYSTQRYLKGFADAIVPLNGSPEEKTEALLGWFQHEPKRSDSPVEGAMGLRDPVKIVQSERLLKVCGSASNAFMNLAVAADLKVRRLLLLDSTGNTMHVTAEVLWGDRWIAVNPQTGQVFRDHEGRALTKEELRNPSVFQDAISRMPGYSPSYTFGQVVHIRLRSIPVLGKYHLRNMLNRWVPGWEDTLNWGYLPENPPLWLVMFSFPLFILGALARMMANRFSRKPLSVKSIPPVQNP